jgi:chromosome segregation ATPase
MSSPLSFLAEHENMILAAYIENNSKPKDAWICLEKDLPELSKAMTFNTFKQYMSVFAFVKNRLDMVRQNEVTQKLGRLTREKNELELKLQHAKKRLDAVRQDRSEILNKLEKALEERAHLESRVNSRTVELDKVRQKDNGRSQVTQRLDKSCKRISGWSVQYSKDGYYRCYRKIGKRVHSVYLGKELNIKEAESRISAKEKNLGLK